MSKPESDECRDKDYLIPTVIKCFATIAADCETKAEESKVLEMIKLLLETKNDL